MAIVLLLGLALTGIAVVLTVRVVAFGRLRRRETLTQVEDYGFTAAGRPLREPGGLRELSDHLAASIGGTVLRRMKDSKERELLNLLRAAGLYQLQPETFLGYRIALTATLPGFWLLLAISAGNLDPRTLAGICLVGGLGWVLPRFLLERRGTKRVQSIEREMPELVDLLVTTVEAGVGFASSLQLVAGRVEGALGQELRLALQEQNMGLTMEEALEHMIGRVDSPSLRAFVQAIIQGQTLGVSIGKILRGLAVDMRKRRRQMAEERAQKAPTKILFPLVVLILPALMIVSLGGPLIGLVRSLNSV